MMKKIIFTVLTVLLSIQTAPLKANDVYPLTVFTDNGDYSAPLALDLYMKVVPIGSMVGFEIYNDSLVDSSIARIYFDDNEMLSLQDVPETDGTSFAAPASPPVLPAGRELTVPFEVDINVAAVSPPPQNGINPGESATVRCNLINGATFTSVTEALNSSALRIGIHVIALPDGSSEAAVTPEPASLLLMGLGTVILRKRNKTKNK